MRDYLPPAAGFHEFRKEPAVYLEHIELRFLEHVQRGISRAEIVHQHGESRVLHLLDYVGNTLRVGGFGYLQLQQLYRDIVLLHEAQHFAHDVERMYVLPGDIYRDGHRLDALAYPLADFFACALPDYLVELQDKAVLLEHRNEIRRGYHALFRVYPPRERFRADYPLRGNAELRLEVHHELITEQRVHHVVLDGLLLVEVAFHSSVEEPYVVQRVALYGLPRYRGIVAVPAGVRRPVLNDGNAEYQAVLHIAEPGQHALQTVNEIQQLRIAFKRRNHHENVGGQPCVGLLLAAYQPERVVHEIQQVVPRLDSVLLVDELEPLHIELYERYLLIGVAFYHLRSLRAVNARVAVGRKGAKHMPFEHLALGVGPYRAVDGKYPAVFVQKEVSIEPAQRELLVLRELHADIDAKAAAVYL